MACYSDAYKHRCGIIVILVSFLMGIMAITSIVFGVMQLDKIPMESDTKAVF